MSYHCENIEKEIKYLQLAANQGHPGAAYELALMHHEWGLSYCAPAYKCIKNNEKAFNYLKSWVDRNKNYVLAASWPEYVEPKLFISMMYLAGKGVPQDVLEGFKYYDSATNSKHNPAPVAHAYERFFRTFSGYPRIPVADYLKGLMCKNGEGIEQNYFEAAKSFDFAAQAGFFLADQALEDVCGLASQQGDRQTLYKLGKLYDERRPEKAFKYYQMAADAGWLPAQAKVGHMYCYGVGTAQDSNKALLYLVQAAYPPNIDYSNFFPEGTSFLREREEFFEATASALCDLGVMSVQRVKQLSHSNIVLDFLPERVKNRELRDPISHFTHAAERGNTTAQYNLATMYYHGEGTPQDFPLAFQWYRRAAQEKYKEHQLAAQQKNRDAQLALFDMFFADQGVSEDFRLSDLKELTKDNADVQFNFGKKYAFGQGIPKNPLKAYKYFARAVKLGYSKPLPLAEGMTLDRLRDQLLTRLKLAASDGDISAQYGLGDFFYFLYRQGPMLRTGRENLYDQAIHYLTLAADKGHALAQKKLGSLYDPEKEELALKYSKLAADQGMVVTGYNWCDPFKTVGLYFKNLTEKFKQFQNPQLSLEDNVKNFKRSQPLSADQLAFLKKLVTFVKTEDTIEEKSNVLSVNNTHETKESTEQESGLYAFFTKTEVLTNDMLIKSDHHSPDSRFKKSSDSFVMEALHPLYRKLGEFGHKMDDSACDIQKNLKTPGFMVTSVRPTEDLETCEEGDTEDAKTMYCFLLIDNECYSCMGDTVPLGCKLRTLLNEKDEVLEVLELLENNLIAAKIRTDVTDDQYAQIDAELALLPRARKAISKGCRNLTEMPKVHLSDRNKGFEKENELFFH